MLDPPPMADHVKAALSLSSEPNCINLKSRTTKNLSPITNLIPIPALAHAALALALFSTFVGEK